MNVLLRTNVLVRNDVQLGVPRYTNGLSPDRFAFLLCCAGLSHMHINKANVFFSSETIKKKIENYLRADLITSIKLHRKMF